MPAPRWLARFNRRFLNHLLGPVAVRMPGMGVVVHHGRRTHRRYRTPVLVFRRDHHVIIALTYGRESQWVNNVLAEGGCDLDAQGHVEHLRDPRVFRDPQRRAMPAVIRLGLALLNVSEFLEMTST